jgi:DNA-binding PadR family transcriptional regulator
MLPFEHLQKTNTKDNLWIYILLLLRKKDVYGWELPAMIEAEYDFKPGKITPYRVLYRLEADGLVESKEDQRRRVYKITQKGSQELEKAKNFYQSVLNEMDKNG